MSAIELDSETPAPLPLSTIHQISRKFALPSRTSALQTTKQILHFLLPSFLHSDSGQPTDIEKTPEIVHPTAWLDGMRGIAALLVYIYHLSYSTHDVDTAWTYDGKRDFLRLPLIRFFYNGPSMVSIFFVLSGYALSYKPVKQIRKQEVLPLFEGLASSVFRRWMRLFLPCLASTSVIVVLLRLGMYDATREIANDQARLPFHRERHAQSYETLGQQLWDLTAAFFAFSNPFIANEMPMDPHLWTISVEYGASIVLYVTQLGLCRLRTRYRLLSLVCLIFMAHQASRWPMILFYGGFILAELDIRRSALAASETFDGTINTSHLWSATYLCIFFCGLFLGGQPWKAVDKAPGWITLYKLIPKHVSDKFRYWGNWGAILLIWATSNSPLLQCVFTNRVSQYFGRISFSLYVVHGMLIHTLHYSLMPALWNNVTANDTWLKQEIGFAVSASVVTVVLIWVSDVFMRLIDTPSVRFARWIENKAKAKVQVVKEEPKWMESSAIV
ncbi:hypothetical protein QM012_009170 [Aureobasidium pullulans]|uniref:Acyltransferase 3 domain-containing protein n=1 Tax=Aureobasidium pullulans TaxID=5580 RepID=A0ABR0TGL5_AURPU